MIQETYQYIRCLYCTEGKEAQVVRYFTEHSGFKAIHPKKVWPYFRDGGWMYRIGYLMRSYVFLYGDKAVPKKFLLNIPNVEAVLGYIDDEEGYLRGQDRAFAELLLEQNGLLNCLRGMTDGNRVEITDEFMRRFHATVMKVDKHKRSALVAFPLLEDELRCWFGYTTPEFEQLERLRRDIG